MCMPRAGATRRAIFGLISTLPVAPYAAGGLRSQPRRRTDSNSPLISSWPPGLPEPGVRNVSSSPIVLNSRKKRSVGNRLHLSQRAATRTPKEEQMLIDRFGQQNQDYIATTGRFFPRIGSRQETKTGCAVRVPAPTDTGDRRLQLILKPRRPHNCTVIRPCLLTGGPFSWKCVWKPPAIVLSFRIFHSAIWSSPVLQPCANPDCSVHFAVGIAQCPACGTPSRQPLVEPAPTRRNWTALAITRSVICTGIGAFPGGYWLFHARSTQAALVCGLGAFVGFELSLPNVSIGRVMSGMGTLAISKRRFGRLVGEALNPTGDDPDALPTDDRGRRS